MLEYQDYYKTLGVARNATPEEIKKSYRRLARKYHPDVSKEKNAEEHFKRVKEAYEVLKDPEKRQRYDQMGAHWQQGDGFKPPPGWQRSEADTTFATGDFSEFFENLFGGLGGGIHTRHRQQRGQDQHSKINLSLEEAYQGTTRVLRLQEPHQDPQTGQVRYQTRELRVKIPPGVTSGQQIRLQGQGLPGMGGGTNGDLYLEVLFMPHTLYTVQGKDVYLHLPITPWEAALGAKVSVPTLGGTVELTIPANSQTGQKLRLKNRGLPPSGDQYVLLKIYIPEPKTEAQKRLYQQMAEQMQFNPRENLR